MTHCSHCGYEWGHAWTCPTVAKREYVAPQGYELHPAGTRDKIAALEAERDAVRQALAEAGHPVGDLSLAECIRAQEADVSNWIALAEQYKARGNYDGAVYVTPETSTPITELYTVISELMHLLGSMRTLVEMGAGDDAPEARVARDVYRRALDLIGAPPDSDYSYGGLDPLSEPVATNEDLANGRYLVSVYTQRAEAAAHVNPSENE